MSLSTQVQHLIIGDDCSYEYAAPIACVGYTRVVGAVVSERIRECISFAP